MRVGLITDRFDSDGGGAEWWIARFADFLLASGHEVHVIAFQHGSPLPGITAQLLNGAGNAVDRARTIERAVPGLPAMVLYDGGTGWSGHLFHPHTGSNRLSLEREIATHVAWRRVRAGISPRTNWRRLGLARVERRAVANAGRIIAVSGRIESLLARRYGLSAPRLVRVMNGVDTDRFRPADPAGQHPGTVSAVRCLMVAHRTRTRLIHPPPLA